jgi:hypothetical protein
MAWLCSAIAWRAGTGPCHFRCGTRDSRSWSEWATSTGTGFAVPLFSLLKDHSPEPLGRHGLHRTDSLALDLPEALPSPKREGEDLRVPVSALSEWSPHLLRNFAAEFCL